MEMELKLTKMVGCNGLSTEAFVPITGITTDALTSTRSVVGLDVYGPGENITATVSFKRDRDGSIRYHDVSEKSVMFNNPAVKRAYYCHANLRITEKVELQFRRVESAAVVPVDQVPIVFDEGRCYPVANEFGWINNTVKPTVEIKPFTESFLSDEAERITKGNVDLGADGSFKFDGYRVMVIEKEDDDGITYNEITVSVPSKKGERKDFVNKYTGYAGWFANRMIPAIDYAFRMESGIVTQPRPFAATCDECMQAVARTVRETDDQDSQVFCSLGLTAPVEIPEHYEQFLEYESIIGNSVFLRYSEEVDDITCLPSSEYHMQSATASNRGRVGYELPGWFNSTERANEVIAALYMALINDFEKLYGNRTMAIALALGKDPGTALEFILEYEDMNLMMHDLVLNSASSDTWYDRKLPGFLFDVEDGALMLGRFHDINDPKNGKNMAEAEKDVLPDLELVMELTANLHPLVSRLVLEGGLTREDAAMFPNLMAAAQNEMLAETNPRLKRVGKVGDFLKNRAFGNEVGCLWFAWKGTRQPAHGAANYHALEDLKTL